MRKYIIGFLVGSLLTVGTSVYGADIASLVGKKVQGEASVSVDGANVGKILIIDGKSYAPVRVIGESAGYSVTVNGKDVNLTKTASGSIQGDGEMTAAQIQTVLSLEIKERDSLNNRIKQWELVIADPKFANNVESLTITLNSYKASLEKVEKRIAELQAQLAELQSQ